MTYFSGEMKVGVSFVNLEKGRQVKTLKRKAYTGKSLFKYANEVNVAQFSAADSR